MHGLQYRGIQHNWKIELSVMLGLAILSYGTILRHEQRQSCLLWIRGERDRSEFHLQAIRRTSQSLALLPCHAAFRICFPWLSSATSVLLGLGEQVDRSLGLRLVGICLQLRNGSCLFLPYLYCGFTND